MRSQAHPVVLRSQEWDFYTVLFGVGRALGWHANITWDRGLGYAIERPKSVTTAMLRSGLPKAAASLS